MSEPAKPIVPSQIPLRHYANAVDISPGRARRRLRNTGLLDMQGRNAYVGDQRLQNRLPDDWERVYQYYKQGRDKAGGT